MKRPANPFLIGKYLDSRYFCDREAETELLLKSIRNGRDVTLISQRRMGKTGLIKHFFSMKEIAKEYATVFIDIYATKNLAEFAYLISNAVYQSVKGSLKEQIDRFFKSVSSLRIGLKLDTFTGEPTLDLHLGQIKSPEATLEEIFKYLDSLNKPVIIAIDEFQQIGEYSEKNTEALLRTLIQRSNNIHFIFAGSKRHIISNMFNSPSRPFYQSSLFINLGPIKEDIYRSFAIGLFQEYDRDISPETVNDIYRMCHGVTWYNQVLLNELFSMTEDGGKSDKEMIPLALSNILSQNSPYYLDILSRVSERQKQLLIAIAKAGDVREITSQSFVSANGLLSASSVQSSLRALMKIDLVTKEDDTYRITDIFFSIWLAGY